MIQVHSETSWKIWVGVGALGAVLVYLATFSAGSLARNNELNPESVSYTYEMARATSTSEEDQFDLSGRQVNRTVLGDDPKAVVTEPNLESGLIESLDKKNPGPAGKLKADPKKQKLTPAQQKALDLRKKAEAQKKAVALRNQNERLRRRAFEMNVLEARKNSLSNSNKVNSGNTETQPYQISGSVQGNLNPESPEAPEDEESAEDKELTKSVSQWRTLLQVSPTSRNVAQIIRALDKKKIDSASFYNLAKELLMDSAPDRRKAGLMMVSATPSVASYSFLVTQAADMSPEVQSLMKKEIERYSQPSLLTLTSRIVGSTKDPAVLNSALGNVSSALEAFKKQPAAGTISSQSGNRTNLISVNSLTQFLGSLRNLSESDDPALAARAQTLTQSIQDIKK